MQTPVSSPRSRTGPILAVVSLALMTIVSAVSGSTSRYPTWLGRPAPARPDHLDRRRLHRRVRRPAAVRRCARRPIRPPRAARRRPGHVRRRSRARHAHQRAGPVDRAAALMGIGAAAIMPTTSRSSPPRSPRRPAEGHRRLGRSGRRRGSPGPVRERILLEFFSSSSFFGLNVVLRQSPWSAPCSSYRAPSTRTRRGSTSSVARCLWSQLPGSSSASSRAPNTLGPPPDPDRPGRRDRASSRSSCGSSTSKSPCSSRGCPERSFSPVLSR